MPGMFPAAAPDEREERRVTRSPRVPSRIVVRPPNWLGDAVLALPAMAAVRRHFPRAHLTIAARAVGRGAVPRGHGRRGPITCIELPADTRAAVGARSKAGASTSASCFPNSFRSAWQFWRAGIRERWGYATSGRGCAAHAHAAGPSAARRRGIRPTTTARSCAASTSRATTRRRASRASAAERRARRRAARAARRRPTARARRLRARAPRTARRSSGRPIAMAERDRAARRASTARRACSSAPRTIGPRRVR